MKRSTPARQTAKATRAACPHCGDRCGDCQCWFTHEPRVCLVADVDPTDLRPDRPLVMLGGTLYQPNAHLERLIAGALHDYVEPGECRADQTDGIDVTPPALVR